MEKTKMILKGVLIGIYVCGLAFCVYQGIRMYKAIAYTQADIRSLDAFLKYQVEQGKLVLPQQQETVN